MSAGIHPRLCYCTNVHPGASWAEVLGNLNGPVRDVRRQVAPGKRFGLGMWWSNDVVAELSRKGHAWEQLCEVLRAEDCYVATLNGFPYGPFHEVSVKDRVHEPDWTTTARLEYTKRLFSVFNELLPDGGEAGISTSPLSYRPWHEPARQADVYAAAVHRLVDVVVFLHGLREATGKLLHLDLEPEPDGLLESSGQVCRFFHDHLLAGARDEVARRTGLSRRQAEQCVRDHLRVCFDVCHFSVVYEPPVEALQRLLDAGIGIGKVHLSAALKWDFEQGDRRDLEKQVEILDEPTYLHQVVQRNRAGGFRRFPDLRPALAAVEPSEAAEWRTHFHVPLFAEALPPWRSTREDVVEVLDFWKREPFTNQLEIETYTWAVLPESLQRPLTESIAREFAWVEEHISGWH